MYERESIEILHRTRVLLAEPEAWTQEGYAMNKDGELTAGNSPDAVCWNLPEGISKCCPPLDTFRVDLMERIHLAMLTIINGDHPKEGWDSMVGYNDAEGRTHGEVLHLIDRTMEKLETEA